MAPETVYHDLGTIAFVLFAVGIAAIVKGAIGFGFPLVALPLLATVFDARSAVIVLSLAALFGNVGIALRGGGNWATFRRISPVFVGVILGTVVGALLLANINAVALSIFVGSCAVVFAGLSTWKPNLAVPSHLERYLGLPLGLAGGILGGSTSIFAPPIVSYLHALHLGKREFVIYVTLIYLFGGLIQVASYTQLGLYDARLLLISLATCVPNGIGLWIGVRLQDRLDPVLFRRLVLVVIFLTGLNLIVRGIWR